MENYLNNPMMNMFRKAMENPTEIWSMEKWTKLAESSPMSESYKNFNPGNWMNMSGKMMENFPWLKNSQNNFNFSENMKNVEMFADMNKVSLESAQAMLRRQAEIIQKHSTEIYKLMQNMVSSPNPEAAMQLQAEFMQMAFDSLVSDFKELSEMFSKANLEHFEMTSSKISDQIKSMNQKNCHSNEKNFKEENNKKGKNN
jgi:phasin family protein